MKIPIKKFGEILVSRLDGIEAALVMRAYYRPKKNEKIELDFDGVLAVGPTWLNEVLSLLRKEYGKKNVICLPTENASVIESLKVIDA
jgi:hypothetical protein